MDPEEPPKGSLWKHYNGGVYTVLQITEIHQGHPAYVIYQGANGKMWCRRLSEWHEKMKPVTVQPPEPENLKEKIRKSMERAFHLGGDYAILAESESHAQNKRAGEVKEKHLKLMEEMDALVDQIEQAYAQLLRRHAPSWGDSE